MPTGAPTEESGRGFALSTGCGRRDGAFGYEGVAQEDAAQGVQRVESVLARRGDVAADTAEVHEGVGTAEGA